MAESPRIIELQQKFEDNPRRFFASLANEYRKAGDAARAISICRIYIEKQPTHMAGHVVLGQALHAAGKLDEAEEVFETVLQLDPENLIALRCLGDIAQSRGDLTQAHENFRRVLTADPRDHDTNNRLKTVEQALKLAASKLTEDWIPPRISDEFIIPPGSPSSSQTASVAAPVEPSSEAPPDSLIIQDLALEPSVEDLDIAEDDFVDTLLPDFEGTHHPSIAEPVALESAEDTLAVPDLMEEAGELPQSPSRGDDFQYRTAEFTVPSSEASDLETTETSSEVESESEAFLEDVAPPSEPQPQDRDFEPPMRTGEYSLSQDTAEWNNESGEGAPSVTNTEDDSHVEPDAVEPAGPFITETVAELYLQQGFTGEALLVYRQLARSKPDDSRIAGRILTLEERLAEEHAARQAALDTPVAQPESEPEPEPEPEPEVESDPFFSAQPVYSPPESIPAFETNRQQKLDEFDRAWAPAPPTESTADSDDWFALPDAPPVRSRQTVHEFFAVLGKAKAEIRRKPARTRVSADDIRAAADVTAGFGAFGTEPQHAAPKPITHPSPGGDDPQDDVRRFRAWLDGLSDS